MGIVSLCCSLVLQLLYILYFFYCHPSSFIGSNNSQYARINSSLSVITVFSARVSRIHPRSVRALPTKFVSVNDTLNHARPTPRAACYSAKY